MATFVLTTKKTFLEQSHWSEVTSSKMKNPPPHIRYAKYATTVSCFTNLRTDCSTAIIAVWHWWTSSLPLGNAYAHSATVRYGKVSLPQASSNAVWHCRAFLPLAIWILMKHLCSSLLKIFRALKITVYLLNLLQIYINKNVNVRLYITCNLRKFFTDRLKILTQPCIRIREC